MNLDIERIRSEFPILSRKVGDSPFIYFDNTATSQTPRSVVESIVKGYECFKANVHRGVHTVSQEATERQETTRTRVRKYLNASEDAEIIFTRGTTESINLVAASYGELIPEGSEIILTVMEHHSNIVPWQLLAKRRNLTIKVVDIDDRGYLCLEQYEKLFSDRTALVTFCHVSNVLGTVNPVKEMVEIAHRHGAVVHIDGAQASPHLRIDVRDLDVDFYSFSSHKMYGPTGVGVLYGRRELLERMQPWQGGGEMIGHVSLPEPTTFAELPFKFEAGRPDFVGIGAFSSALDFIESIGLENIESYEVSLLKRAEEELRRIPGIRIFGSARDKSPVLSFLVGHGHPYDTGFLLDKMGIAVRTGHHCAQPLMERLGIPGTVRASFAVYNTEEELDRFVTSLQRIIPMLS